MSVDLKTLVDSSVSSAIRNGDYSLLLGAGASIGATSKDGKPLPSGDGLSDELIAHYGLKIRPGTGLQHVWEAAADKVGSEAALRKEILEPRFVGCRFAKYQTAFSTFSWKRIFSFNVDDSLLRAYVATNSRFQEIDEVHFDDVYTDSDLSQDRTQLVYLHGSAGLPGKKIVFSAPAYGETVRDQHTWFHVFADAILSSPFIVIGASLREPDLETYLSQKTRNPNPLAPRSFYVDPGVDDDDAAKAICKRLGLTPVALTGEAFLNQLSALVEKREKISARLLSGFKPLSLLGALGPQLAVVAGQFFLLPKKGEDWQATKRAPELFYEGNDPEWDDIVKNRDVSLSFEADIAKEIRGFLDSEIDDQRLRMTVISDSAGTGKTTAAMRVSQTLAKEGRAVLYFSSTDRLRDDALLAVFQKEKTPFVVVIDHLIDQSIPISRILSNYPKDGPRCFILGAERKVYEGLIKERLSSAKATFREIPKLNSAEANELGAKLRAAAKLGQFSGKTDKELAEIFVSTSAKGWAGQLLVILLEVTQKDALKKRLVAEWASLPEEAKRFYGYVCIASACGVPIRSARAYAALGRSKHSRPKVSVEESLKGLILWKYEDGDYFIKPKHRVIAEEVVKVCISSDEIYEFSFEIAKALAPYVNKTTVKRGTADSRLMRQIMDEDGRVIPRFQAKGEDWFLGLQEPLGWNSRYWEQRALHAMRVGERARAMDFARSAVGIEQHVQPLTTYARIFIDSAEKEIKLPRAEREKIFREGLDALERALLDPATKKRLDVHPYHLLFDVSVRVCKSVIGDFPEWFKDTLKRHVAAAVEDVGNYPEIKMALSALKKGKLI